MRKEVDYNDLVKEYAIFSQAWYADQLVGREYVEEVMIRVRSKEDKPRIDYEFGIRWYILAKEKVARLEMFDESWGAFGDIVPLFHEMFLIEGTVTPAVIIEILDHHGFRDATEREPRKSFVEG